MMICIFLIIIVNYIYSLHYKHLTQKRTIFYASSRFHIKKYEPLNNETTYKDTIENRTKNILEIQKTNDADLIDLSLLNKEKIMELKIINRQLYDYYIFINKNKFI